MIIAIEQKTDSVVISYIDQGERKFIDIPKTNFWNWKKVNYDTKHKSFLNENVERKRLTFKDKRVNKFSLFEWINSQQELTEKLYKFEIPKILFCDIETEVVDGFPKPELAKESITSMSFAWIDSNDKIQSLTLGYKEEFDQKQREKMQEFTQDYYLNAKTERDVIVRYKKVKDEKELLNFFVSICSKFHVLTGWYFEDFDWPYIKNRFKNLNMSLSKISPHNKLDRDGNPTHFIVIDYMALFKKNDRTVAVKESMTLEFISNAVLDVGKLSYAPLTLQELYEKNYYKYILYNAIDTINVLMIHDKCKTLTALLALSNLCGCEISRCQSPVSLTEGILSKRYLLENKVIPYEYSEKDRGEYEGAYVRPPITGLHKAISCFDFSSLYPSIARQLNISPESFIDKETMDYAKEYGKEGSYDRYKADSNNIDRSDDNYIISVTGCKFDKEESVLKKVFNDLYKDRKVEQKRYKVCDKLAHELKQLLNK